MILNHIITNSYFISYIITIELAKQALYDMLTLYKKFITINYIKK